MRRRVKDGEIHYKLAVIVSVLREIDNLRRLGSCFALALPVLRGRLASFTAPAKNHEMQSKTSHRRVNVQSVVVALYWSGFVVPSRYVSTMA